MNDEFTNHILFKLTNYVRDVIGKRISKRTKKNVVKNVQIVVKIKTWMILESGINLFCRVLLMYILFIFNK